ncbi:hypothetical protein [Aestuariivirga sp.]|uniref:hypothetical protein n=1 Tax=Aestuariivirga sp. TaxID=2650926 RepID=UPI0039E3FD81
MRPFRPPSRQPYRSITPWTGFTPREKRRPQPLPRCPALACCRAKACIRAIDGLYCRRTHMSVDEAGSRARNGGPPREVWPTLPPGASFRQVEAYRIATDMLLAEAEAARERMTAKWKRGDLEPLYGRFDPRGVWMYPPERRYVEE